MSKSLDRVLQPDGSYKWEEVELKHSTIVVEPEPEEEVVITEEPTVEPEVCPAPEPKVTKKKVAKKKTTNPLSE